MRWDRWLVRYVLACVLWAAVFAVIQVALDPYDTGRLVVFGGYGVPPFGPRLSSASLARRPDTEAAILGNSTIQNLDPVQLTKLTGRRFVSLSLPATGPIEQLAVGRWLMRHHDGKAGQPLSVLVIDIDARWCRGDGTIELTNPFPYWLYSDNDLIYAVNLVGLGTFGAVGKKLKAMLGQTRPHGDSGYHDYDRDWPWNTEADLRRGTDGYQLLGQNFAGMRHLQEFLPQVPPATLVILLHPPRYHTSIPAPDTEDGKDLTVCKAGYRKIAEARPRTAILDLLKDDPLVHIDASFLDRAHYLRPVSSAVENAIGDIVRTHRP